MVLCGGGIVVLHPFAPVIAGGVREDRPVVVEGAAWDGLIGPAHRLEPLLAVLVPEVVRPVRTGSRERSMDLTMIDKVC